MRFVSFEYNQQHLWGIEADDGIYYSEKLLSIFPTLDAVIENYDELNINEEINQHISRHDVTLIAPFRPKKNIMCIGKNYREHALEMTNQDVSQIPDHPVIFTKSPGAVIGPNTPVDAHQQTTSQLDYEGELAVVIGKQGKNIAEADALDYVFGYTLLNDITARDLQKKHQQFFRGKSLDTFAPFGPSIVTPDEIDDVHNLALQTYVNDELRQDGHTSQMIFDVRHLIATLSDGMTLEPGDIIATGTPSGVGKGFNPPKFLNPGDAVRIEIEQIGQLVNSIE
ncbi:fumarylacetoacetate hydrolase family protein [Alkalibacillus salilacus]|uniref:2-keto-4-pentenoate hydratase/2-oxohepta-3-ene-1,7-dioic acid hydratase in catechol pathway n=1 Tax=Alkalibacillus salilacus TaxID=284582 RepID=A0ABT9VFD2_9BACI|nr:fumarylacetoacetate hydrolase family protein [Alkalibacillus salilacus]MDQ0159684.1 2-keto-4-pentenoate hydratase/2-oxohepta-3-ene-1,7-dioic acid hydratase in catechol pathway [Alkalibacillus salilacus]